MIPKNNITFFQSSQQFQSVPLPLLAKLALSILLVGATFTGNVRAQPPLRDRIDRLVAPYLENEIFVGMSIGIVTAGEPKFFGYGKFSADTDRVPDKNTLYEIGSISKVFTGLLLADAEIRGEVQLDQSVGELLPEGIRMPSKGDQPITLKHLATHCSGLPRLPDNIFFADFNNPYATYTDSLLFEFLDQHRLEVVPGTQQSYSNLGAGLLGHLLAKRQQLSYERLLHARITNPLQLNDTAISLSDGQSQRLAVPYADGGAPASNWDIPVLAGAGAIRSTAADLIKFAQANLQPPEGEVGKAIDLAWKIHQDPIKKSDFAMGLGWHLARDGSTRWHNGQTGGYHGMLMVNRKLNIAVVLLANTATGEIDPLAGQLMRILNGQSEKPRQFEKTVKVDEEVMRRYVGRYQIAPGAVFTVTKNGNKLFVQLTGQSTLRVYPKSESTWYYKAVEAELTFQTDESGECQAVELFQAGIRQQAKRIDD